MDQSIPTDINMETYNHVIMTSDVDWDPAVLDTEIDVDDWNKPFCQAPPTDAPTWNDVSRAMVATQNATLLN